MTPEKYAAIAGRITPIFRRHLDDLGLSEYTFDVLAPGDPGWDGDKDSFFCVSRTYPYKSVRLHVSHQSIKQWDRPEYQAHLQGYLLHEAFHIVLWRIQKLAEDRHTTAEEVTDAFEETVDHLANVWLQARRL